MADSLHSLCAGPVFKRPRLDCSPENGVRGSLFDSLMSEDAFRDTSEPRRCANEVTSSTDSQIDMNGGDSGFHESLPATNGIDSTSTALSDSVDYQQYSVNEPDSSSIGLEGPLFLGLETQPPDKDSDDNDYEDVASTISDFSAFSDCSGQNSNYLPGPYLYVQRLIDSGKDPRAVLMEILPSDAMLPPNLSSTILWRLVLTALSEPPPRAKLRNINTVDDVISLLKRCHKIIVLTGAGVSVSCGIPDFRSRNGVYARLSQDYPDLPDPSAMFDITYFKKDPRPFFKFAKEIYPGQFQPSPSHHFIRLIEKQGKLLRNYTQNIDTLEHAAGIKKVITCHGSFATASCTVCHHKVESSVIKEDIFNQSIPYCWNCHNHDGEKGIMKPDIVFFGEGLSDEFHESMAVDKDDCDLLVVMGSSLKVRPVACIPSNLPPHVPQILINREPLRHFNFDVELLGDCDVIIGELCRRLAKDWDIKDVDAEPLKEITSLPPHEHHFRQFQNSYANSVPSTSQGGNFCNGSKVILEADTTSGPSRIAGSVTPPSEEESNSCDCRGMSAIKLDDSQDGSVFELPNNAPSPSIDDCNPQSSSDVYSDEQLSPSREPVSARLPERSYLFVPPCRYIFQGAEVYHDNIEVSNVSSNSPIQQLAHTDSSSISSEEEDFEGITVPEREIIPSLSPDGDLSSLSNSDDQSPTTSPRNDFHTNSTHFKYKKENS